MTIAAPLPWHSLDQRLPDMRAGRLLVLFGLAFLAAAPLSLAGMILDPRMVDAGHTGLESVWLKPLKFQLSVGVHLATIGLCLPALAEHRRSGRLMWILAMVLIGGSILNTVYITYRGALGIRSHFATDLVGAIAFQIMGLVAVGLVVATAIVGGLALRGRPAGMAPHLHLAIGLGLLISGVAGLISGAAIGENGGPLIAAAGGAAIPLFGWSTTGGDLRVAHFFGLHAAQFLPLLALAIGPRGPLQGRLAILTGAALLTALIAFAFMGAQAGQPFLAL